MAKRSRSRKSSGMNQTTKMLLGALGYAVVGEPLLDMVAQRLGVGVSDDIVKGVGGYFIAQNTSGVVRSVGVAAMTIAAYKFGLSNFQGKGLFNFMTLKAPVQTSNGGATF